MVAYSLHGLACAYRRNKRYDEADPLFRRAIAIREENLEPDHPLLLELLTDYAILLRETGRAGEAGELEAQVDAARE
jgi:tetratricopeptide (TPR) repeat protein